jgi:hypothetical protein
MRAFGQSVCKLASPMAARKMAKDLALVELTKKNRHAFWDSNVPQATIEVKRVQVMLESVSHISQTGILQNHAHVD